MCERAIVETSGGHIGRVIRMERELLLARTIIWLVNLLRALGQARLGLAGYRSAVLRFAGRGRFESV